MLLSVFASASLTFLSLAGAQVTTVTSIPPSFAPTSAPPPQTTPGTPSPAGFSEFTSIPNQHLFITDGSYQGNAGLFTFVSRFYSLDLSTSWKSDSPAWKSLPHITNYPGDSAGPIAATLDGKSVFFFTGNGTRRYDISSSQYSTDTYVNLPADFGLFGAVTDLDDGQIYSLGSAHDASGRWNITAFDPIKNSLTYQTFTSGPNATNTLVTVYSGSQKSLFTYKSSIPTAKTQLSQYDIAAQMWTELATTGAIPPLRVNPCFASAYNGTKLILAGGASDPYQTTPLPVTANQALGDIYMLDVKTLLWTQLPNMPNNYYGSVCAVSGDSFVIWGGYSQYTGDRMTIQANTGGPSVLNLNTNTWGTSFSPVANGVNGAGSGTGRTSDALNQIAAKGSLAVSLGATVAIILSFIL